MILDVLVLILQWGCLAFLAFGGALSLLALDGNVQGAKFTSASSVAPAAEPEAAAVSERRLRRRLKKAA